MQFTIESNQANLESYKYKVLRDAHFLIYAHTLKPGEIKLNNYLLENYKVNLKAACVYLVSHCKIYRDYDNTVTILFPRKKDDQLASLITYGNGHMQGSTILKEIFFRE